MSHKAKRSGPVTPGVAFVTGGARGLGNAIAVAFARDGASGVVLVDIQDEETFKTGRQAVEAYGTPCITVKADVTKEDEVEKAVAQGVERFGRIDYAANFAGVLTSTDEICDIDIKRFEHTMAVNSTGVLLSVKYELRQMMKQESIEVEAGRVPQRGAIVNAASVNSSQTMAGATAYSVSKHGVAAITKTAAMEARQHHIRVNAVAPGFLRTGMNTSLHQQASGKVGDVWATFEARQGRVGGLEEVGDAVVLLCTTRMSLVNGAILAVDNGFTISETASDVTLATKSDFIESTS